MKDHIINRTIEILNTLPQDKVEEIYDFVCFIAKRYEDEILTQGIQILTEEGGAFDFLNNEDETLYTLKDLKERYNQ
jgi:hypothetical protein